MMSNIVDLNVKPTMSSKELVEFRLLFKLSQKGLAGVLGVSWHAVDLWESGQRKIPETTYRILKLFMKYPSLITDF